MRLFKAERTSVVGSVPLGSAAAISAAVLYLCMPAVSAQPTERDFAVFASIEHTAINEALPYTVDDSDATPTLDFIFSQSRNRFRVLGEYLLTDEESELERFQAGWQLSEDARIWFGRFHHSGSYWNTEHHHGQFLQTSIFRPATEEFVDKGGIMPQHVTGVLLEQRDEFFNGSAIQISLSAGISARLDASGLETFDLLSPDSGFEPAINARVSYFPDALGDRQVGVSAGRHHIAAAGTTGVVQWDPTASEIELETIGIYADWSWKKLRLLASSLRVSAVARGGLDGSNHDFTGSYFQLDYSLRPQWKVFARLEHTTGDETYLFMFPRYVRRQSLAGAKRIIGLRHAITIEGTNSQTHQDHFHRISIQWSTVFP